MEEVLKNYFSHMASQNRISHAFLLCNTDYASIKNDLSTVINSFFLEDNVDIENSSDVIIINPIEDKINKEQILSLQEQLMTKSTIHKNRVYIINDAHKMNEYASNSLLKFLEEPQEGIYAFLITTNINKMLPTIKSRCQVLSIQNVSIFDLKCYTEEDITKILSLISLIEQKKTSSFGYLYDIINKKEEKSKIILIVRFMKYFYSDVLNNILGRKLVYFDHYSKEIEYVSEINTKQEIIRKLLLLSNNENKLNYNLNVNLFMIKLIIEMVGGMNEKCSCC